MLNVWQVEIVSTLNVAAVMEGGDRHFVEF